MTYKGIHASARILTVAGGQASSEIGAFFCQLKVKKRSSPKLCCVFASNLGEDQKFVRHGSPIFRKEPTSVGDCPLCPNFMYASGNVIYEK